MKIFVKSDTINSKYNIDKNNNFYTDFYIMQQKLENLINNSRDFKTFTLFFGKYQIANYKDLIPYIEEQTKFLDEFYPENNLKQRLWHLFNKQPNILRCEFCNEPCKIHYLPETNQMYSTICSDRKCLQKRKEKTNLEKYGFKNPTQVPSLKEKRKQTCIEKYGVENPSQVEKFKEKRTKTNMERYGVPNAFESKIFQEKQVQTCIDRYGKANVFQVEEFKEKSKKTCLEKFGVEYASSSKEFKERVKATSQKKYGMDSHLQSEEVREKIRNTNIEKFGVHCNLMTDENKEKIKQTCLVRYGKENYSYTEEYSQKIKFWHQQNRLKQLELFTNLGYEIISYDKEIKEITFKCPVCGEEFTNYLGFFMQRHTNSKISICTNCIPYNLISGGEKELSIFISSFGIEFEENNRSILEGKEIDIYIPTLKIGFEYNGIYWHSDDYKTKEYHQEKKLLALTKDVNLVHVWEDDWKFKRPIIESRIKNILGLNQQIFARKTKIKEIDSKTLNEFLERTHLQGNINSSYRIGLFNNDKLVSVMSFGNRNNKLELLRFSNELNTNVVGGFSKLLSYFIKTHQPEEIITYADLDWSNPNNNVYLKNGFIFNGMTQPGYYWCHNEIRQNRMNFQKFKLVEQGFDPNKTENEIMFERGFKKVYNSGNLKYSLRL